MNTLTAISTSLYSAKIAEPIILSETSTTRKILRAEINDRKLNTGETVKITIVHQHKNRKDEWEDLPCEPLSTLKGDECVKLPLDSEQTKKLFDGLKTLYLLAEDGIDFGLREFEVVMKNDYISIPEERKEIIRQLLEENHADEVWEELGKNNPSLATHLANVRIQETRLKALQEFEAGLSSDLDEKYWQKFFEANTWIFGFGLDFKFLQILQREADVSSIDLSGKNGVKCDFLMGDQNFTVLVELKRPDTRLFTNNQNRSKSWQLSSDLIHAISQIHAQKAEWQIKSASQQFKANGDPIDHKTIDPKAILIIGNSSEFSGRSNIEIIKAKTFEAFRRDLRNVEILTFDELYHRAECLFDLATNKM